MKSRESMRSNFSTKDAEALALMLWKVRGMARELPSERDQNFHICAESGGEYVLKIANAREKRSVLELQVQAIRHLTQTVPEYAWPEILKTGLGEDIAVAEERSGEKHFVRLMGYLPGRFLSQVKPHSEDLLRSLGIFLGSMDKAFAAFQHPAADRELKWNMKSAPLTIRGSLHHIVAPEARALVLHFLGRYEEVTVPLLPRLRTIIIHNDANDNNILVGRKSPETDSFDLGVTGIIDFGDMVAGYPALDLAVGATYAALDKNDPLAAAAQIVAGYHQVFPLTELEIACLYGFIVMRLCLSVVISAEQRKAEPANEYLSISEKPAWAARSLAQRQPRSRALYFPGSLRPFPMPSDRKGCELAEGTQG